MKYNNILSINEIALLKSNPKEYYKTHDGTSMGGLRKTIQGFAQKYALESDKHISTYNNKGEEINHVQRPHWYEGLPEPVQIPDEIWRNNKELDMISNLGGTDEMIMGTSAVYPANVGGDYKNNTTSFHESEYGTLIQKNMDGEYSYRSITSVSPDGSSMTLIKNNNFNTENETKYTALTDEFHKDLQGFARRCKQDYSEKYNELERQGISSYEATAEAERYTYNKNGTMHEYIKEKGYPERFEQECNTKLRLRNPKINTAKPPENRNPYGGMDFPDVYNNEMGWTEDDIGDKLFIDDDGYIIDEVGNRYGKYE